MRLAQRESFPTRRTRREEQEIGEIDDEIRLRLTGGEREQQDEQQQQQQQQHAALLHVGAQYGAVKSR